MDNSLQQQSCILCQQFNSVLTNTDLPICSICMGKQANEFDEYYELNIKENAQKINELSEIDEIIANKLYLGNEQASNNLELLKSKNITDILVCGDYLKIRYPKIFNYKQLAIQDSLTQSLLEYLDESYKFIDQGQIVFVHCAAGINRSPAIVCAYLMKKNKWNYNQAFDYVKCRRQQANKQTNFAEQLQKYQYY